MTPIRTKDMLFVTLLVPVLTVTGYVYFWRNATTRQADALAQTVGTLVAAEDFPFERTKAERLRTEAIALRTRERETPVPATRVKGQANETQAARELAVLEVFREAGLTVLDGTDDAKADPRGEAVLRATGVRPEPVCRAYVVRGNYNDVQSALNTFATREMAAIPIRVEKASDSTWSLSIWL